MEEREAHAELMVSQPQFRVSAGASRTASVAAWTLFAGVLLWCGTVGQPSPDLWFQLAGGRLQIDQGVFPWTDPFSFTAEGRPWMNHEWLAERGMYLVYKAFGLGGLHAVRLLLVFVTYWISGRVAVLLGVSEAAAAGAATLALLNAQWAWFFDVRPYLCTYLGLAITLLGAMRWLTGGGAAWLWVLPPFFALWANLHSGVVAGLVMLVVLAVGAMPRQRARAIRLALLAAACAAACLLNPYGIDVFVFPLQLLRSTVWATGLNEWAHTDLFGAQRGFTVYLVLVLAAVTLERRRLGLPMGLLTVAFGGLACSAWRHIPPFAIISVPAVAALLQRLASPLASKSLSSAFRQGLSWAFLVLGMGLIGVRLHQVDLAGLSLEKRFFPVDATRFLQANPLPSRVYNAYGWGGYIDWSLSPRYRVFMDGRANTLFAPEVYRDYLRIGAGALDWSGLLDRYRVGTVLLNQLERGCQGRQDLFSRIASSPEWGLIYADDIAEIYVRRDSSSQDLWEAQREGRLWYPATARLALARGALEQGRLDAAEDIARSLIRAREDEARACTLLAVVQVRRGRPQEAEALLRQAILIDPQVLEAHFDLGALLMARGDTKGARVMLEEEVRLNPDFLPAREQLEQMRQRDR